MLKHLRMPAKPSIYFQYYTNQALHKAGLGNEYFNRLAIWKEFIKQGATTYGEDSKVNTTRSDCHAWSASPNIEFFRIVFGIESDAAGFSKVKIEPHLGDLKEISGTMPHPKGEISVNYKLNNKGILKAEINLPQGISGSFIWNSKVKNLTGGKNSLSL